MEYNSLDKRWAELMENEREAIVDAVLTTNKRYADWLLY
jgi:hypothetical protein